MPDELRRLPAHAVAPLLRALMTIPRRPESRLYLRRVTERRMTRSDQDYRVFSREDHVGDIWLDEAAESIEDRIVPWRWSIDTTRGGTDMTHGWWSSGRTRTLDEAMDAFRNAWDGYQPKKGAG